MNYLPRNLTFDRGVAYINGVSLLEVSKEHATPLYVFDWDGVEQNIVEFKAAFGEETLFRYAAKAFICKELVSLLNENNWGIDVVSGGEMATVVSSVGSLENTLFNGTFKTIEEINFFMNIRVAIYQ